MTKWGALFYTSFDIIISSIYKYLQQNIRIRTRRAKSKLSLYVRNVSGNYRDFPGPDRVVGFPGFVISRTPTTTVSIYFQLIKPI